MDLNDVSWVSPNAVLAVLVVTLLLTLFFATSTTTTAFGVYNSAWDGASDLQHTTSSGDAQSRLVLDTRVYTTTSPEGTVALIISPQTHYSRQDRQQLREFVRDGGTLVVASDFRDRGNDVLKAVGASTRFDGRLVRDERSHSSTPAMPVATAVSNATLMQNVSHISLNYATVLRSHGTTVLARTSEYAFLDANRNGKLDDDESMARYPVVSVESVGRGRVVAVSDPSIFINSMLHGMDNAQFVRNLVNTSASDRVLLDYSHADGQPPLAVALLRLRQTPWVQSIIGVLGLAVAAIAIRRTEWPRFEDDGSNDSKSGDYAGGPDERSLLSAFHRERPDGDENHLRRVVKGVITQRRKNEDDE